MSIDRQLAQRFRCVKCHSIGASNERIAVTGTGLSKLMDVQHNKFIALSCHDERVPLRLTPTRGRSSQLRLYRVI